MNVTRSRTVTFVTGIFCRTLHLKIQSFPSKHENLKLLLGNVQRAGINFDFCVRRFLRTISLNYLQFLVTICYKNKLNRWDGPRRAVAIYFRYGIDFKLREYLFFCKQEIWVYFHWSSSCCEKKLLERSIEYRILLSWYKLKDLKILLDVLIGLVKNLWISGSLPVFLGVGNSHQFASKSILVIKVEVYLIKLWIKWNATWINLTVLFWVIYLNKWSLFKVSGGYKLSINYSIDQFSQEDTTVIPHH